MSRKHISGILIACLVLVAVSLTANGDTLSEERREILITGLLEKGYKQDEISGLIELAGLAGGPSISKEARDICLKILTAPVAATTKTGNQQQKRAAKETERQKQLEKPVQWETRKQEKVPGNEHTQRLTVVIALSDSKNIFVGAVEGATDLEAAVLVAPAWHYLHYQARLLAAKDVLAGWRIIRDTPYATVRFMDKNGRQVGGTTSWRGEAWVEK